MGIDWEKYMHSGVPKVYLGEFEIEPETIEIIPRELIIKYSLIPLNRAGATLVVAMVNPHDQHAISEIMYHTGYKVEVVQASEIDIKKAIRKYLGIGE